jgi:hypothetical protein
MGIRVYPYTVMPVQVGRGVLENWGGAEPEWCWSLSDAEIASNIHITYIQCILTYYYDVEGHMGAPLTLLRLCRWEWISRKIGVGRSLSNVVMSWLRLQTCTDCIPHPCHMYTQCFSTLICSG